MIIHDKKFIITEVHDNGGKESEYSVIAPSLNAAIKIARETAKEQGADWFEIMNPISKTIVYTGDIA